MPVDTLLPVQAPSLHFHNDYVAHKGIKRWGDNQILLAVPDQVYSFITEPSIVLHRHWKWLACRVQLNIGRKHAWEMV